MRDYNGAQSLQHIMLMSTTTYDKVQGVFTLLGQEVSIQCFVIIWPYAQSQEI